MFKLLRVGLLALSVSQALTPAQATLSGTYNLHTATTHTTATANRVAPFYRPYDTRHLYIALKYGEGVFGKWWSDPERIAQRARHEMQAHDEARGLDKWGQGIDPNCGLISARMLFEHIFGIPTTQDWFGKENLDPKGVAYRLNLAAQQYGKAQNFRATFDFNQPTEEALQALLEKHQMASVVLNIDPSEYDAIRAIYKKNNRKPPDFDKDEARHFVVILGIFPDEKGVKRVFVRNTHGDITAPTIAEFAAAWRAREGAVVYDFPEGQEPPSPFSSSHTPSSNYQPSNMTMNPYYQFTVFMYMYYISQLLRQSSLNTHNFLH